MTSITVCGTHRETLTFPLNFAISHRQPPVPPHYHQTYNARYKSLSSRFSLIFGSSTSQSAGFDSSSNDTRHPDASIQPQPVRRAQIALVITDDDCNPPRPDARPNDPGLILTPIPHHKPGFLSRSRPHSPQTPDLLISHPNHQFATHARQLPKPPTSVPASFGAKSSPDHDPRLPMTGIATPVLVALSPAALNDIRSRRNLPQSRPHRPAVPRSRARSRSPRSQ